jgi:adenylate cyclase
MSEKERRATIAGLPRPPQAVRGGMELLRRAIRGPVGPADIDFDAEGLLEGLKNDEREARRQLLQRLANEGVSLEELRRAVDDDRLALLPVERVLAGEPPSSTFRELAEASGLDVQSAINLWRAFGAAIGDPDELAANDEDLEAARAVKRWREAGVSEEGMLEIARAMRHAMSTVAAAMRSVLGTSFVSPDDSELEVALRYARVAGEAASELDWLLGWALRIHQRNQLALEVAGAIAEVPGARDVAVCFADLVGFTSLGEHAYAPEIAAVAGRLDVLAAESARAPVQLVKMIGDAVMLVSPDVDALIESAIALNQAVTDDASLPQLRIGIACGPALSRAGDWFGQPVNLASRLTALASPGQVLVTGDVRDAAEGGYAWTSGRRCRVKGLEARVQLFCVGPLEHRA